MARVPRLAITAGDPAGVGPEVCLKACEALAEESIMRPVLVGPAHAFAQAADMLGMPVPSGVIDPCGLGPHFLKRAVSAECGSAALRALEAATAMAVRGEVDAIVTAPLNKEAIHAAGASEPGHTEILARLTGVPSSVLLLYSERLACGFVTCHQSLASVPGSLSSARVIEVARLMADALRRLRGHEPSLGLLALNPHAGENGIFGREEIEVLLPAAAEARRLGIDLSDPIPPDTAFTPDALKRHDGFVCMYHDQGGIPFKMVSFHDGVNVTLGLPIVRTSPDHGTAFDIAWRGRASATSMIAAIRLAARLAY